jgi:hypothetical protein
MCACCVAAAWLPLAASLVTLCNPTYLTTYPSRNAPRSTTAATPTGLRRTAARPSTPTAGASWRRSSTCARTGEAAAGRLALGACSLCLCVVRLRPRIAGASDAGRLLIESELPPAEHSIVVPDASNHAPPHPSPGSAASSSARASSTAPSRPAPSAAPSSCSLSRSRSGRGGPPSSCWTSSGAALRPSHSPTPLSTS